MGCCFRKGNLDRDSEVECNSTTMNAAVTCKAGVHGEEVQVATLSGADGKTSFAVAGNGTALGSCSLDCDVGLWEVKIGKAPEGVQVGIKRYNAKKNSPLDGILCEDGSSSSSNSTGGSAESPSWCFPTAAQGGKDLAEGDVVSVYWDQTDLPMLSYCVNGVPFPGASVSRIRPSLDVYPAISLRGGSSAEFIFDGECFKYPPKGSKFQMIICSTSLI